MSFIQGYNSFRRVHCMYHCTSSVTIVCNCVCVLYIPIKLVDGVIHISPLPMDADTLLMDWENTCC